MVALYTARICKFFVERLCSGLWSGSFSVFPPSHPYFSSFHCFISVTGAWNGGSWLGCGDLPAMGAVFYLGAGWPQWKPLGIPGTHLPLKRGIWLTQDCWGLRCHMYLQIQLWYSWAAIFLLFQTSHVKLLFFPAINIKFLFLENTIFMILGWQ